MPPKKTSKKKPKSQSSAGTTGPATSTSTSTSTAMTDVTITHGNRSTNIPSNVNSMNSMNSMNNNPTIKQRIRSPSPSSSPRLRSSSDAAAALAAATPTSLPLISNLVTDMSSNHQNHHHHHHNHRHHPQTQQNHLANTTAPPSHKIDAQDELMRFMLNFAQRGQIEPIVKAVETRTCTNQTIDDLFLAAAEFGHCPVSFVLVCFLLGFISQFDGLLRVFDLCSSSSSSSSPLLLSPRSQMGVQVVEYLASKISGVACVNQRGESALTLAAKNGHLSIVAALIRLGATVDFRSRDGSTPLMAAVIHNQSEVVAFLLEKKANVNMADNARQSVLHFAASGDNLEIVQLVLRAGAATNAQNNKKETPLQITKNAHVCRLILGWLLRTV